MLQLCFISVFWLQHVTRFLGNYMFATLPVIYEGPRYCQVLTLNLCKQIRKLSLSLESDVAFLNSDLFGLSGQPFLIVRFVWACLKNWNSLMFHDSAFQMDCIEIISQSCKIADISESEVIWDFSLAPIIDYLGWSSGVFKLQCVVFKRTIIAPTTV